MKKILLLLFISLYAFSLDLQQGFLDPDDAFKKEFKKENDKVVFTLNLGKDIYLYDDKLKVFINKPSKIDITEEVNIPEPIEYDGFIVHFDNQKIEIPFSLLKSKVNSGSYELEVEFQGCSKAGLCYAPMSDKYNLQLDSSSSTTNEVTDTEIDTKNDLNETDTIANTLKNGNMLLVLATFFGFGLLLSFTPCVFPMIPILSSIIVGASQNEKMTAGKGFFLSLIYVLAMAMAYTIAGVIAGLFGANLQVALQNPYVLTVFAAIFIALAFSMFGYFRIELPQSIQNKINKSTDGKEKQGVVGIAIMGFLSALIVGPCVAPPLAGALVYIGQTGDAVLGGLALFVLSMGMGMPLLLIGLGAGKFMPKPGGWMDSVSKVFGIIMLAIAVWMLDRVLDASIVMFLWSALFIGAAIYLNIYKHIVAQVITVLIFLYGVTLFFGTVSGATNPLKPFEKFTNASGIVTQTQGLKFSYIKNIEELDLAIKASSKPVMLDFYADWCVACKELEEITFKDPEVINKLQGFTLLKADVTKNNNDDKALQKKYGIVGPPGLIFWNEDNNEIKASKIVGYKNAKDFLEIVNKYFK
ncbi:protein-disulfide reductase DsbD [Poseidonibacter lekithochrous]|uniref:protein-disulfide reductase DsbD n=1 Tax=Poseidonibacter TaxID=2321187 RepID=UPI001C09569C|nr:MULTISPECIES: protein-disulfide reductase DsbD [Poseidonibacter]MBU3015795.1 protein-disulfide reductase DsbD [Poseidonibacter lekithochrous]MDO6829095.1 protein-disulfide reductase DsbD [Poseidonibacter sp. 1_MG-2023]